MKSVAVNGAAIAYGTGGAAWRAGQQFLVMLHGAGGDHTVWALQARALAQHGWNVAAPDLPGHGRSAEDARLGSIEALADWAAAFLAALGEVQAAWVGHSMGACIALALAARHPKRALALALVGAGETMRVNPELLDDSVHHKARANAFVAAFGHGRSAHFGGAAAPGIWMLGATRALVERCPPAVLHRDFAACHAWEGGPHVERANCPVLVISGEADRMTPPQAGQALAAKLPGARFALLSDAGHLMMLEAPGPLTRALREFFDPLCQPEGAALMQK
jgi:pimeloyl-ACP methyl ester carboxylesterase